MENQLKRILIIEDDRFISEMYARTLRKKGYFVDESMTGPEGLTKAKEGGWDFILLDIMLPDKTGVEVIQEIRDSENDNVSDVKIIIITNFEQDDATRQSMEKLADGYLIKAEITPRRMAEVIEEMSSQPSHHHIEQASSDTAATAPNIETAKPAVEDSTNTVDNPADPSSKPDVTP